MKLLIFGKSGQVGWELQRALQPLGDVVALDASDADFADPRSVRSAAEAVGPDVIVNAAAYTAVDRAETDEATAMLVNAESVRELAAVAERRGAWLVHYSTDYVFDGRGSVPWCETDTAAPLNAYGRTKLAGEKAIAASTCKHLVFRSSWVYAARGQNFVRTILRLAGERQDLRVIADQHGVPTSAEFLADATCLAILRAHSSGGDALSGTYHLAPRGHTCWHGIACETLRLAAGVGATLRVTPERVAPIGAADYPLPAPRPSNSRLNVDRVEALLGIRCPDWRVHLERTVAELVRGSNA